MQLVQLYTPGDFDKFQITQVEKYFLIGGYRGYNGCRVQKGDTFLQMCKLIALPVLRLHVHMDCITT